MSDDAAKAIAAAVRGADRGFRVIDGGPSLPPPPSPQENCPVLALGHLAGIFHFLDVRGQKRDLSARQLGARDDLLSLFGGEEAWLREAFPKRVPRRGKEGDVEEWIVVDFHVKNAASALQRACFATGLFGDHLLLRRAGIWAGPDGVPVVHCGDQVLLEGEWRPPGARAGHQIWIAGAPVARPDLLGCAASVGVELQARLAQLWDWDDPGGPVALMGLIANAYYGAAMEWRPAAFVLGGTGSGKSALLRVIRAALPVHHHSNDSSKAGLEQAIDGRAIPMLIDEASDRADREGARRLVDLVLSATGDEGTRGTRGTTDGRGRKIEVSGAILMFSIRPPQLEPQHLGRFTILTLRVPEGGADHRDAHRATADFARAHGAMLWGRALVGYERYAESLHRFRAGLAREGCGPREMDQAGALVAGWWVLTHEGFPDARDVREGIAALGGLLRTAAETRAVDRPTRAAEHFLASAIVLNRSTERKTVGALLLRAWGNDPIETPESAREWLSLYGIRVVREDDGECQNGRPVPRLSPGDGIWLNPSSPLLVALFRETPFDGARWQMDFRELHGAGVKRGSLRVGGAVVRTAIWVSRAALMPEEGADDG